MRLPLCLGLLAPLLGCPIVIIEILLIRLVLLLLLLVFLWVVYVDIGIPLGLPLPLVCVPPPSIFLFICVFYLVSGGYSPKTCTPWWRLLRSRIAVCSWLHKIVPDKVTTRLCAICSADADDYHFVIGCPVVFGQLV
ncbi:hypothetical protein BD408DRAFT_417601 [Parasitella parasitica]|nr:hypothetical protein BD408DRAFT_417601 [Parasitella parasitica]